jgi:uncharacterized membrane protein
MRSRWVVAVLVVSLVLNLLAAGFIVGRLTGPPAVIAPDPTAGYGRMLRFLPDERREAVSPMLRRQLRETMKGARTLRREHSAVFDALTADPFEPAALEAALAELRETLNATQETAHRALVELAGSLSLEERRQLAEAMRKPPWRSRERGAPGPPPGPRP